MSLLNSASLVVTPNGYKEGTLYSVIPNTTLGDMTVVRATTATRVNSAGLIELVPYNLLTYSEALTPNYTFNQCSITSNQTDPNGTNNAKRITNGGTANDAYFEQSIGITNNTYTWSIFVKQGTATTATIRPVHVGIGGDVSLLTFTFATQTITSSGLITTSGFIALPNGWFRIFCSIPITNAVSSLRGRFGNPNTPNVYNDWFGAQLVEGSTAKDYLRTETRLNIPRLDYSNGTCPSILVEPQRTNVVLYSEQFDNAAWNGFSLNATVTANTTISPDGTQNADTVVFGASGFLYQQFAITGLASATFSIYAKTTTQIPLFGGATPAGTDVYTILNVGNGWYRQILTRTFTGGGTGTLQILPFGNNITAFLWGCQVELASYPTSYIPTTSAAVTRNADVISKTGISALIGQTEGAFFVDFYATNGIAPILINLATSNQTYSEGIYLEYDPTSGSLSLRVYTNGVLVGGVTKNGINLGTRYKVSVAYKANDTAMYVDGVLVGGAIQPNAIQSSLSQLYLGNLAGLTGNATFTGAIVNSAALFPTRLTNAELISLTT